MTKVPRHFPEILRAPQINHYADSKRASNTKDVFNYFTDFLTMSFQVFVLTQKC